MAECERHSAYIRRQMRPRIIDGKLYVPKGVYQDGMIGDGFVEVKPDDPAYPSLWQWCKDNPE